MMGVLIKTSYSCCLSLLWCKNNDFKHLNVIQM